MHLHSLCRRHAVESRQSPPGDSNSLRKPYTIDITAAMPPGSRRIEHNVPRDYGDSYARGVDARRH